MVLLYYFIIGFIEQAKALLMSAESYIFVFYYSFYSEDYTFTNLFWLANVFLSSGRMGSIELSY